MTLICHVDDFNEIRYDVILGRKIMNTLEIDIRFSYDTIYSVWGPYKGCMPPMVDLNNDDFETSNKKNM